VWDRFRGCGAEKRGMEDERRDREKTGRNVTRRRGGEGGNENQVMGRGQSAARQL